MDSTLDLVRRAKEGEIDALNRVFARYLPALRRWAAGRLPRWARDAMDTDDLVQETVIRALNRLASFEPHHPGALQAYLRQAIINRIRDEVRRTGRAPGVVELDENKADAAASPLDMAIGREAMERYAAALDRLRPEEREIIVSRLDRSRTYGEMAQALGKPSADAVRMALGRALLRLAQEMRSHV
jgi:RNA polymerase sigma-70 factor (ECF subfamily)